MSCTESGSAVLSLDHVGVAYWRRSGMFQRQQFWALKDVSFDLYHGETLGVIGRNGAGKSTLLRLLAGIIAPDKGTIAGNGQQPSLLSLQVGFVPHLSGRENAILSGMMLGMRRCEIEREMDEIISFSELDDFIDQPVRTYSVGMRARLGFAVSFRVDPDILLLDEILGVGDAEFRIKSTAAMREKICSDKTIVLVSHNDAVIQQLCDRAVWIENGVTRACGATKDVLREYRAAARVDGAS